MNNDQLNRLFDGVNEEDTVALQQALAPWSYTKLKGSACPYYVSEMFERNRGRDFKGSPMNKRGGENLSAGIAAHEMIENWILFNMGKERLKQPGEIMSGLRMAIEDWPLLIEQYETAKKVFSFKNGKPEFPGGEIVGVEDEIHVDINWNYVDDKVNPEKSFIKGTIDLIQWDEETKTLTITDHKRQFNVLSDTALRNNYQFNLYASLALAKYPNAFKIKRRMYFIRHGHYKVAETFPVETSMIPETVRQQALSLSLNLFRKKDTARPETGEQCGLCSLAMECPSLDSTPQVNGTIRDQDEASAIATDLVLRKRVVSELEGSLKDWASENGVVSTGEKKQYGYSSNKKESWKCTDVEGFISRAAVVQDENQDLFSRLRINMGGIIQLKQSTLDSTMAKLKKHGQDSGDWLPYKNLQEYTMPKVSTRFSLHNK